MKKKLLLITALVLAVFLTSSIATNVSAQILPEPIIPPLPPIIIQNSVTINGGAAVTYFLDVTLSLTVGFYILDNPVVLMQFTNLDPEVYIGPWAGMPWEPWSDTYEWTLASGGGPGLRTVWARYQLKDGTIGSAFSDSIEYEYPTIFEDEVLINDGAVTTETLNVTLSLFAKQRPYAEEVVSMSFWIPGEPPDDGQWSDYETWASTKYFQLFPPGLGTKTVNVHYKLRDGTATDSFSDTIEVIAPPDTTPPTITITSPQNTTYDVADISLTFTIDEATSWIGYSLDGQTNVTITGNTVLTGLSEEPHTITLYATDTYGNTGKSITIHFTIYIPPSDTTPPTITITSPQNTTYDVADISLTFTIDEATSWIGYSLDGQTNVTITGNTVLTGLSEEPHTITLYATDTYGNTGKSITIHFTIYIPPSDTTPPTASFTYSPSAPTADETVNFDASGSSDSDGTITSYAWDFGDGNSGTGKTTSHAYAAAGTYTINLTVTDNDDQTDTYDRNITVEAGEQNGGDVTNPVADAGNDETVEAGATVTFNGGGSSDNVGVASYEWDFGDGTTDTGVVATHTYTKEGTYTVTLTVRDAAGNSDTDTLRVTVEKAAAPFPLWVLVPVIGGIGGSAALLVYLKRRKPKEEVPRPSSVRVTAEPTELPADGKSRSTVTIELLNKEGKLMPAPEDIEVKLSSTMGKVKSPVVVPKGKAEEKAFLISSKEFGTVKVSADAKGLKSIGVTLSFLEKKRYCMCCGARISLEDKRCPECNEPPPSAPDTFKCKNCGELLPSSVKTRFCRECGASQPSRESS